MARILLVDDDEPFTEVLGDFLSKRGHAVTVYCDPLEAAQRAADAPPEIAILDFDMPKLNGHELLERLRGMRPLSNMPALFLSGVEALRYATDVPPDPRVRFLRKPVDLGELEGAIRALLDPEGWSRNASGR